MFTERVAVLAGAVVSLTAAERWKRMLISGEEAVVADSGSLPLSDAAASAKLV